jgi:hypothetical protein
MKGISRKGDKVSKGIAGEKKRKMFNCEDIKKMILLTKN